MKTQKQKRTHNLRKQAGALVCSCLALIALCVGVLQMNPQNPIDPAAYAGATALMQDAEVAADASDAASSAEHSQAEESQNAPVTGDDTSDTGATSDAGSAPSATERPSNDAPLPEHEENTLLVQFTDEMDAESALAAIKATTGMTDIAISEQTDSYTKLTLPQDLSVSMAMERFRANDLVKSAQPNYIYRVMEEPDSDENSGGALAAAVVKDLFSDEDSTEIQPQASANSTEDRITPNDPYFDDQWNLAEINLPEAWAYVEKNKSSSNNPIVVAVIDEGFSITHPEFTAAGSDSSMIVHPYNATNGSASVSGREDHGTHVAGIIAARANNSKGIAGVGYNNVKVMPIKVADGSGSMTSAAIENAFAYIEQMRSQGVNVRVVNMSLGMLKNGSQGQIDFDEMVQNAVNEAEDNDIVTIAAAGNSDAHYGWVVPYKVTPGDLPNVVSVINLQQDINSGDGVVRNSGSNYNVPGQSDKNISAPGTDIWSTVPDGYESWAGTSMSSPTVAGVAGLMLTLNPHLTPAEVRDRLYSSSRDLVSGEFSTGWDRFSGVGEVDAEAAVRGDSYLTGRSILVGTESAQWSVMISGGAQTGYTWSSSNPSVATVDGTGTVRGIATGTAAITATNPGDSGFKLTKTVTVLGLTGPSSLNSNQTGTYSIAPSKAGEWEYSVSPGTFASINASTGVMSVREGPVGTKVNVTITAKSLGNSQVPEGKTLTFPVVLNLRQDAEIEGDTFLARGGSSQFTVKSGDTSLGGFTWKSLDEKVAKVSSTGLVSGVGSGTTTITATKSGYTVTKTVTVLGIYGPTMLMSNQVGTFSVTPANLGSWTFSVSPSTYATMDANTGRLSVKSGPNDTAVVVTILATSRGDSVVPKGLQVRGQMTLLLKTSVTPVTMHRLYNRYTGEHFYTADWSEASHLSSVGWTYEGRGWTAPSKGDPVYRMYNPYTGDHHYTKDWSEAASVINAGWRDEGVGWYSYNPAVANGGYTSVPLYREYNPYAKGAGSHNYTTDPSEHYFLCSIGWRDEGVGCWYGIR